VLDLIVQKFGKILVVISLVMAVLSCFSTAPTLHHPYPGWYEMTDEEKALSDLKQIAKVLSDYDSSFSKGITSYDQISTDTEAKDLNKLVEKRKMFSVPLDPWGNIYRIDIEHGLLFSQGPDFVTPTKSVESTTYFGKDVHKADKKYFSIPMKERIAHGKDDIVVWFRKPDEESMNFLRQLLHIDSKEISTKKFCK
jgi:hypothetical protein